MTRGRPESDEYGPRPFLKWPGGKRWLAPMLVDIIRHELTGTYFEPFCGAGAIFLRLSPSRAVLSDINPDLIGCLQTVRRHPEKVVRAVWRWSNTRECYYRVRESTSRTDVGIAARFLYLNKTCWGGVYRLNRRGQFNVPFGNSGRKVCRRSDVLAVAKAVQPATIECCDFQVSMAHAGKGDVIYADPPYTSRGQNNGFIRYNERLFRWTDQKRLAQATKEAASRGAFVAVSGMWHLDLLALYPRWWAMQINRRSLISRDVKCRRAVSEVVLFSRKPRYVDERSIPVVLTRCPIHRNSNDD